MKFETKSKEFLKTVSLVERISKKRSIANNQFVHSILIEVGDGYINLRSINNMGIEVKQEATTYGSKWSVLVPGSVLYGLISNISQDVNIEVVKEDNILKIITLGNEAKIETLDEKEFPDFVENTEDSKTITINGENLIKGIESVYYVASPFITQRTHPELSTLYINSTDEVLNFVSASPYRLAERKMLNTIVNEDISILIPIENISDILYITKFLTDDIEITFNSQYAFFKSGGVTFFTRLIDAAYPNYKDLIPKDKTTEVTILKSDLLSFFRKAPHFSNEYNKMEIIAKPEEGICIFSIENRGVGKNIDKIPATINGEGFSKPFNYQYIYDPLQSITSDSLKIIFYRDDKPIIIKDISDESFMYLVMPILE